MPSEIEVTPEQIEYAKDHLFQWQGVRAMALHIDEITVDPVIAGLKQAMHSLLLEAGVESDELEFYTDIVVGFAHEQNQKLLSRRPFIEASGLLVIHRVHCSCINCRAGYSVPTNKMNDEHRIRVASDPNVEKDYSDYGSY